MSLAKRLSRLTLAGAVALLVSCISPTGSCACPPATFDAVVYGTISAADGSAVAGARVFVETGEPGCAGELFTLSERSSGPGGDYRAHLRTPRVPIPGECLRVRATPPAGSAHGPSEPVPFAVSFAMQQVIDSVRVDLVLR